MAGGFVLRIRKNGTSNRRVHTRALQCRRGGFIHRDRIRIIDVCEHEYRRMRRYGALHCVFAKMGPQTGEFAPGPSNIGKVAVFCSDCIGTRDVCEHEESRMRR